MPKAPNAEALFVCPYCQTRTADFEALKAHVLAAHRDQGAPLPEGWIRLAVNGLDYRLPVEPEWTLYELLHDRLGLIGAKQFCDRGACGSCTVILNGRPVLSCMTLAVECDNNRVETVEGIAQAGHPLIEAYANNHAMQCGYCTPGFVVAAKALLDRNPTPTEDEIQEALAGNLCRCGTYPQHPIAVLEAAAVLKERTKS